MREHHKTEVFPPDDPVAVRWRQLIIEEEERQNWQCLTADQIEMLARAFRAGVESKADSDQVLIHKLELKHKRELAHHAMPVVAGRN